MFEDFSFILFFLSLPFFWHLMLKTAGLSLLRFSIPSFVITFFYLQQYVGLSLLYFYLDDYRFTVGVNNKTLIMQVFLYTSLTITLMILGFVISKRHFGYLHNPAPTAIQPSKRSESVGLVLLFLLCVSVLFLYLKKVGFQNIAILTVLNMEAGEAADMARSLMGNAFEGKYHWYYLFQNQLLSFVTFALFAQMLIRPSFYNKVLFVVVFLVTSFSMVMAIEKSPMVELLIALFLVYILSCRSGNISIKLLIFPTILILVLLIIFYRLFMGSEDNMSAIVSAFSRTFTGQIEPAYHYLERFPSLDDYLWGRTFPNPAGLLPFEHYRLTVEMMNWVHPELASRGIVGSMPTIYWGEMYANFGVIGVLIPPFFVGMILYWVNSLLLRFKSTPISIAFLVWLAMHFKNLALTSLSSYFFDIYLVVVSTVFLFLAFIGGNGVIKFRRRIRAYAVSAGKVSE